MACREKFYVVHDAARRFTRAHAGARCAYPPPPLEKEFL
jgi:hypothetical protein